VAYLEHTWTHEPDGTGAGRGSGPVAEHGPA
jgi:hypothetical protein